MSETMMKLRRDVQDWLDGVEHTEEWDADVLLRRCIDALLAAERELAGVRKVEAWLRSGAELNVVGASENGGIEAVIMSSNTSDAVLLASANNLAALGHAISPSTTTRRARQLGHALSPEVPDTPREATGGR